MENRRSRMSKKMMREALVELLQDKPIEKVTIKEICERADVNRSTFYDHYEDIFALMKDVEGVFLTQLPIGKPSEKDTQEQLLILVEHIKNHVTEYQAIRQYGSCLQSEIEKLLITTFESRPKVGVSKDSISRLYITYAAAGSCSIVDEWIRKDYFCSSEQLATVLMELGMQTILPSHPKY